MSVGSRICFPEAKQGRALVDPFGVDHRATDVMAGGGQEGEGHAPADDQDVHPSEQRLQHAELVGHLGPAHHGYEGPGR